MIEKTRPIPADFFSDWKEREALSEAMIPLIGSLYREKIFLCICMAKVWLIGQLLN